MEGLGKYWAEPDIEDAARAMWRARRKASTFTRGISKKTDAALLKTLFSFASVGDRYRERLNEISG